MAKTTGSLSDIFARIQKLEADRMSLLMDLQAHLGTLPLDAAIGRRRGRSPAPEAAVARKPRRRRMSPETRAKLAASAKKRWAEAKKAGKKRLG